MVALVCGGQPMVQDRDGRGDGVSSKKGLLPRSSDIPSQARGGRLYFTYGTSTSSSSVSLQHSSKTRALTQGSMSFLLTVFTTSDTGIFILSSLLAACMKKLYSMETPWLSIVISSLCSFLKKSMNSCSVISLSEPGLMASTSNL